MMTKVELAEHIAKEAGITRKAATKSLGCFRGSHSRCIAGQKQKDSGSQSRYVQSY